MSKSQSRITLTRPFPNRHWVAPKYYTHSNEQGTEKRNFFLSNPSHSCLGQYYPDQSLAANHHLNRFYSTKVKFNCNGTRYFTLCQRVWRVNSRLGVETDRIVLEHRYLSQAIEIHYLD